RQAVRVHEVYVVVRDGGVRDVLTGAGVLVVVQLLRDGRPRAIDRQHLEVARRRIAPVPAAAVEHPVEVTVQGERVRAAAAAGAGLPGTRVGALTGRAVVTVQETVERRAGGRRVGLLLRA